MNGYYHLLIIIPAIAVFLFMRYLFSKNKSHVVSLFKSGLKEENTGRFEAAIRQYELALAEAEKKRFNRSLKLLISEKLKLLHTITEYEKDMCMGSRKYKMTPQSKPE
jgi:hypothetical protein